MDAAEIASDLIEVGASLPYVGPVCTIIQNIVEIVQTNEDVRQACKEDIPKELEMMQVM